MLNLFRVAGDFSHLASILILLHKMTELNVRPFFSSFVPCMLYHEGRAWASKMDGTIRSN